MATKPGSGGNNKNPLPDRDTGFNQDQRPTYIPGKVQERSDHGNTVSRVQPRRDGGGSSGGGSGGGSNGR